MHYLTVCTLGAVLALPGLAPAKPAAALDGFNGTWILRREKSTNHQPVVSERKVVTIDATRLGVDYHGTGDVEHVFYPLDGSESVEKREGGPVALTIRRRLTLRDAGSTPVLRTEIRVGAAGPADAIVMTETWRLIEGGTVLREEHEDVQEGKTEHRVLVYQREGPDRDGT
jgi:hypothetical protein